MAELRIANLHGRVTCIDSHVIIAAETGSGECAAKVDSTCRSLRLEPAWHVAILVWVVRLFSRITGAPTYELGCVQRVSLGPPLAMYMVDLEHHGLSVPWAFDCLFLFPDSSRQEGLDTCIDGQSRDIGAKRLGLCVR